MMERSAACFVWEESRPNIIYKTDWRGLPAVFVLCPKIAPTQAKATGANNGGPVRRPSVGKGAVKACQIHQENRI
jgi:hypothetical protein